MDLGEEREGSVLLTWGHAPQEILKNKHLRLNLKVFFAEFKNGNQNVL